MNRKLIALALLVPAPLFAQAAGPSISRADFQAKIGAEFTQMDSNKDGSVTSTEVEAWQAKTAAEIATARNKAIFARLDADKNGAISAAEFAKLGPAVVKPNAAPLMARVDTNKDGKITKAEHGAAVTARFNAMDANKDGTITQAEAQAAAKK